MAEWKEPQLNDRGWTVEYKGQFSSVVFVKDTEQEARDFYKEKTSGSEN